MALGGVEACRSSRSLRVPDFANALVIAGSIPAMMRRGTAAIVRFRLFAENAQSSSGFETMVVTTAMLVN
jgi:hypothetical protein